MRNTYKFQARFLVNIFDVATIQPVVKVSTSVFNGLRRKYYKHLTVDINKEKKCLDFALTSEIPIDPINYLRACQYFSKVLSTQPGMSEYIVDGRLLEQI